VKLYRKAKVEMKEVKHVSSYRQKPR
jgi:hypothetical protein